MTAETGLPIVSVCQPLASCWCSMAFISLSKSSHGLSPWGGINRLYNDHVALFPVLSGWRGKPVRIYLPPPHPPTSYPHLPPLFPIAPLSFSGRGGRGGGGGAWGRVGGLGEGEKEIPFLHANLGPFFRRTDQSSPAHLGGSHVH